MSSSAARLAPAARVPTGMYVAIALLVAMGAAMSARMIAAGSASPVTVPSTPFDRDRTIATSFGRVTLQHVDILKGLTAKDLAGMTHGIQNYVPPDKAQVQASITLTNTSSRPVEFSPINFGVVSARSDRVFKPSGSNVQPGFLRSGASIDAVLNFVVPRDGSRLWLEFLDPTGEPTSQIDIGRTSHAPAHIKGDHQETPMDHTHGHRAHRQPGDDR